MKVRRRDTETGEFKHVELGVWDVVAQGLTNEQLQGALIMAWRVGLVVHVAWVCGLLGPIGLATPFAKAADVSQVKSEVTSIVGELKEDRLDRLETEIFATRRLQCSALKTGTVEQQRQYADRLNELVSRYRKFTQAYPRVPSCDEV